jgi:hypothetical protein
MVQG